MSIWRRQIQSAVETFLTVAELAGKPLSASDLMIEYLPMPHQPPTRLPPGKMAVYGFYGPGGWLKIGKAGPKSAARYTTQHYGMHAPSTLAKSLVADPRMAADPSFDPASPGEWIRASTCRFNILLDATHGPDLLALLEAFLHLRLKPGYEGFQSQRTKQGGYSS